MTTASSLTVINSLHRDVKLAKQLVYDKCGFEFTEPNLDFESPEYGACSFKLNGKTVQHRVSKITPVKTGQFVTIWKRSKTGQTEPFDISGDIDFLIVTSRNGNNFGQFIFPKSVLADKAIITSKGREGKRGIRVYPPWDKPANRQACKTQSWQIKYFFAIDPDHPTDLGLIQKVITKLF